MAQQKIDGDFIAKIFSGSANMNTMRTRVEHFLSMTLGLIPGRELEKLREQHTLVGVHGQWTMEWRRHSGDITITYDRQGKRVLLFITRLRPEWNCSHDESLMIYEDLAAFLSGLVEIIPSMESRLAPFLRAAEIKL